MRLIKHFSKITTPIAILFIVVACAAPTPTAPLPNSNAPAATAAIPAPALPTSTAVAENPITPPADIPTSPPPENTATPSPILSPTPVPATLTQLTEEGCCAQPFWTPDSKEVLFIDKPTADSKTGIYGVSLDAPKVEKIWRDQIAFYTDDLAYTITPDPGGTIVERISDGQKWTIKNGGRNVQLSPDRTRLVWTESRDTFPTEQRVSNVMLANIDGSGAKRVASVLRGGVSAWLDNDHLLMTARLDPKSEVVTLFVLDLNDGTQKQLAQSERLRSVSVSPGGEWLLYSIAFDKDPTQNGIWLMRPDGTDRKKVDWFGSTQWRDASHVIYIPLDPGAASHVIFEYDASTGSSRQLTDPAVLPFKIANGDWDLSPDGTKIAFMNAADQSLWLLTLPSDD